MNHLPGRMLCIYRTIRRAHGTYLAPPLLGVAFGLHRGLVTLSMWLDDSCFPRLRATPAAGPIVIVGNPRSGTTFLQRFLVEQGFGSGLSLFELLYPSLILQKVLRPFLPVLERLSPAKHHSTAAHRTSLAAVETEDAALLFRYLDGFFCYGFFLSFAENDLLGQVDPRVRDTSARDFVWLEALWRRSLVFSRAPRNVAKLFSLAARLPQFMQRFPEARIIYLVRDPASVVPSTLSLLSEPLDRAFGFWSKPAAERTRWVRRLVNAQVLLMSRFHEAWHDGSIDRNRVLLVRYDRMMSDFAGVMGEICRFVEHPLTPSLTRAIEEQAETQRAYHSEHQYDLAKYGLTREQLERDCAFFYEAFLPPLEPRSEGS